MTQRPWPNARVPLLGKMLCQCHGFSECPAKPLSEDFTVTPPTPEDTKKKIRMRARLTDLLDAIQAEVTRAESMYPPMNSAHEAWSVLYEEVDELWDEVRAKQGSRDLEAMKTECIQVAAMAIRFALDICTPDKVQK